MAKVDTKGNSLEEGASLAEKMHAIFPFLPLFFTAKAIETIRDAMVRCWEDGVTSIPRIEDHLFGANSPLDDESRTRLRDLGVIRRIERLDAKGDR
jgi:hypothetical protein